MLMDSFKTSDNTDIAYGFDHFGRLKVENHDLHEFMIQWKHILDNMGHHSIPSVNLRDVLYRKIRDESDMNYDLRQYETVSEDDPKKDI